MDKNEVKLVVNRIVFGGLWLGLCVAIAFLFSRVAPYNFTDVILIEGILLTIVGTFATMEGGTSASLNSLGNEGAQYEANANLEIKRRERMQRIKKGFGVGLTMLPMIFGGVASILIGMMMA